MKKTKKMNKGEIISIPVGRKAVYFSELKGHNIRQYEDKPDEYGSPIIEERFIKLTGRRIIRIIGLEINKNIPKDWIVSEFRKESNGHVEDIVNKGFNVFINGLEYEEENLRDRLVMQYTYYIDEKEIYPIIFRNGTNDEALRESTSLALQNINKEIDKIYLRQKGNFEYKCRAKWGV